MTPADELLAQILAEPERDDLRLIFADWLEENDQAERAEFIRVQLEIARTEVSVYVKGESNALLEKMRSKLQSDIDTDRIKDLRRRERELLAYHYESVMGNLPGKDVRPFYLPGHAEYGIRLSNGKDSTPPQFAPVIFRRGFIAEITCPLAAWMEFSPAVVRCQPVEAVRVSDREPWAADIGRFSWWLDIGPLADYHEQSNVPKDIFKLLPDGIRGRRLVCEVYDSPEAAHEALSVACLKWAKKDAQPAALRGAL